MLLSTAGTAGGALALNANSAGSADPVTPPTSAKPKRELTQLEIEDVQSDDLKVTSTYIVTLAAPPLSRYEGGTAGIPATAAYLNGGGKLNLKSKAAQFYMRHLEDTCGKKLCQEWI